MAYTLAHELHGDGHRLTLGVDVFKTITFDGILLGFFNWHIQYRASQCFALMISAEGELNLLHGDDFYIRDGYPALLPQMNKPNHFTQIMHPGHLAFQLPTPITDVHTGMMIVSRADFVEPSITADLHITQRNGRMSIVPIELRIDALGNYSVWSNAALLGTSVTADS